MSDLRGWGLPVGVLAFCGFGALFVAIHGGGVVWAAGGLLAVAPAVTVLAVAWVQSW